ncbi:LytTR family DNA-binding domain-containing protein [uncultured Tenacibaculum sp.]|uniref:LytR/AlgR family response regulator transcription factor n=1 Tax=uncultured Tenacibaculum sp. TaxID=174713 RepID=UPI00260289E0|nr:LytTR family DNA-binding domain-containing protein [uncultured Tenacibaculum sp.]
MTTFLIIDDEPIAHRIIENYCAKLPHLKKTGNCYNAFDAIKLLNEQTIDLIFLDINMPELTGFEMLKTLNKPPKVIVTTAYEEFALEGYELNISDYLLKPFSFSRFMKAVNKTLAIKTFSQEIKNSSTHDISENFFFVKGDKKHHQINANDILYIEAYGNYTKLFLTSGMIITHEKISHYESILSSSNFLRVHKSFIIAKNKIESIEGNQICIQSFKIPIGRVYKSEVTKLL